MWEFFEWVRWVECDFCVVTVCFWLVSGLGSCQIVSIFRFQIISVCLIDRATVSSAKSQSFVSRM